MILFEKIVQRSVRPTKDVNRKCLQTSDVEWFICLENVMTKKKICGKINQIQTRDRAFGKHPVADSAGHKAGGRRFHQQRIKYQKLCGGLRLWVNQSFCDIVSASD